jgi:hypothetical protein
MIVCIEIQENERKQKWIVLFFSILGNIKKWTFSNMWLEFIKRLLYFMV